MATSRLEIALSSNRSFQFLEGACLINLGTSWHADYLLKVRNAKQDFGVRFVPFVHDLIPIVTPQFVLPELTQDYITWLLAVFDHADFFLSNSRSTRADLIAAAHKLGHILGEENVLVVPLDARFSAASKDGAGRECLRAHGLYGQPFVLFVSTVEPRKNHLAALNAWAELINEYGSAMPKLVCAGGKGWLNDDIYNRVANDEQLSRHVLFIRGLSDADLAACYDACLFTLFPSHYEGWGLPVTESLCHGKVPMLSNNSSLPEAGGPFGVYFEAGAQGALTDALRRLIGDTDYRLRLERKIELEFRPRKWAQLAEQISEAIHARFAGHGTEIARTGVAEIFLGAFYEFARNTARRLRPGLVSGAALRAGTEWHSPEDWGSWARSSTVEIAGRFPSSTRIRAFIGVKGMPGASSHLTITVDGREIMEARLPGSESRWLPISFETSDGATRIAVHSDRVQSLASVTDGEDGRIVGPGLLGFYACAADDVEARLSFIEALASGVVISGALDNVAVKSPSVAELAVRDIMSDVDIGDGRHAIAQSKADEAVLPAPGTSSRLPEIPLQPNTTRSEIILLQSSDPEIYAAMLAQSARTTRAYAERHGYRYESFVGIKRGCLPWHASYNRIDMLMDLIAADFQGWVFYIDADAWIEDLDFDLKAYLAGKDHHAMIAAPAGHYRDQYWNVNNGVLLLNLGHSFARALITEWERFLSLYDIAAEAKGWNVEIIDDQGMFHQILDKLPYAADAILTESKDFLNSPWATFVRHAIRAENADFAERLALITEEVNKVMAAARSDA